MSATVQNPATVRELTRHVEREYPDLDTSYNARHEQVVIVGPPGQHEPPAALREVLGSSRFELRAHAVASRGRWVGAVTATACESCGETPPYAGHRELHDVSEVVDADAVCTNCILEDAEGMFATARDDGGDR